MRLYLDTSALVKLYVDEQGTSAVRDATRRAEFVATSAIAYVEARAAFARRRHEGGLSVRDHRRIARALDEDWVRYVVVVVGDRLIRAAARLAEVYRLRAYDAVHLASAAAVRGETVGGWVFACWDSELERVARRAGFEPLPSAD